ncbi:N-acetylglucosamine kinase [Bacillus timonensis]|uniref:N-acetylglucosamine kinase n=1 Tax=Bacillus timonensis TaxID=1033734 RepID=UPI00028861B9|nr:BadF/BadG/BcrA/BcrD ATPase family protein [Bacillus timonensis]
MNKDTIELLAVDGGGTKTLAVITDANGNILGEGKAGATNYHVVGAVRAKESLVKAVLAAFENAGIDFGNVGNVKKAVVALAGIDTENDEKEVNRVVLEAVKELSIKIDRLQVENDCLSALLGSTQYKAGVLLIAGTGSIVFAHDANNRIVRSGGWGHRFGDEGSGYWIGKQAIKSVLKMQDGRGEDTLLAKLILRKFNFNKIEDLYNWAYSESYSVDDVGALATTVDEAFRLGDPVSKRILERAVEELLLLVNTAVNSAGIHQNEFDLILQGGVFQHNHYIKNQVRSRIQLSFPKVNMITTTEEPIQSIIKRGLKLL